MVRLQAATFRVAHLILFAFLAIGCIAACGCSQPCENGQCPPCCGPQCAPQCGPQCTPCACPDNPFDAQVPAWRPAGAIGEAEADLGEVNESALSEPKGGGGCSTCPRRRAVSPRPAPTLMQPARPQLYSPPHTPRPGSVVHVGQLPPIVLRPGESLGVVGPAVVVDRSPQHPATMPAPQRPSADSPAAYLNDVREGVFNCVRCNKAAVGRDWHEVWGDDDTPLTILCEHCWRASSAAERRGYLAEYMESAGLTPTQRFYARAAFEE